MNNSYSPDEIKDALNTLNTYEISLRHDEVEPHYSLSIEENMYGRFVKLEDVVRLFGLERRHGAYGEVINRR